MHVMALILLAVVVVLLIVMDFRVMRAIYRWIRGSRSTRTLTERTD